MAAPVCPNCGVSFADPNEGAFIGTSQSVIICYNDEKWEKDTLDNYETFQCSECHEELSVEELDNLGVPNEIR